MMLGDIKAVQMIICRSNDTVEAHVQLLLPVYTCRMILESIRLNFGQTISPVRHSLDSILVQSKTIFNKPLRQRVQLFSGFQEYR